MAIARGQVDLSNVPGGDFRADMELRVAVTHGDDILGSTVIKASAEKREVAFAVEFTPILNPGIRIPCPIRVIVGPNVADSDLLGLDVAYTHYDFVRKAPPPVKEASATAGQRAPAPPPAEEGVAAEGASDEEAARSAQRLTIDVGRIVVADYIYRCWLFCCRTYHIRGRVVCRNWHYNPQTHRWSWCDDPVPGAEVDIYDVDRFLWWYHQDLITTVTTHPDGTFEANITWCCTNWWPGRWPYWYIDDDVLAHIRALLAQKNVVLPPIGPDPDPIILQSLVAALTEKEQRASGLLAAQALRLGAPAEQAVISTSAETLRAVLPASAELTALHVWPWWDWNDCAPDVIFRVRQFCRGREEIIHNETIAQTRWNIPTSLNVTLLANDRACCVPRCRDPECPDCLTLSWVGCPASPGIHIDLLGGAGAAGPPDLRGYANPTLPADLSLPAWAFDEPLYGTLRHRGSIGPDIDYFSVQYSKDGGPWTDLPTPYFGGYSRQYKFGPAASDWTTVPFVPNPRPLLGGGTATVIMTRHHYEELNPGLPTDSGGQVQWDDYDTLFDFVTVPGAPSPALGDGLYQLRFIGYATDGTPADNLLPASMRTIRNCFGTESATIFLRIDNQPRPHHPALDHSCDDIVHYCTDEPEAYIRQLVKNGTEHVSVCDLVDLLPTDTLTIHFTVTVPPNHRDGHLGGYRMVAEFGDSEEFNIGIGLDSELPNTPCPVDPPPPPPPAPKPARLPRGLFKADPPMLGVQVGPTYAQALNQGATRPFWYGGNYQVTLRGCDFPVCCAYEIYLRAWKRTTNNCLVPEWTHWNQAFNTFTVLRRDLCPDICRDNQPPPSD